MLFAVPVGDVVLHTRPSFLGPVFFVAGVFTIFRGIPLGVMYAQLHLAQDCMSSNPQFEIEEAFFLGCVASPMCIVIQTATQIRPHKWTSRYMLDDKDRIAMLSPPPVKRH